MLLSKLVYLCVKNAIYYDDPSFTYEQFLQGRYDGDPDYATNIHNAFGPINEAIMRLGDLERIPYRVAQVAVTGGFFPKSSLSAPCRQAIACATVRNGAPFAIPFSDLGDKIMVTGVSDGEILFEYKEDVPFLSASDYNYDYVPNAQGGYDLNEATKRDVDLLSYGISEAACNAIIEYAKGNLNEQVAAELANMHVTRAEQYFANIQPVKSALRQNYVSRVLKIGE